MTFDDFNLVGTFGFFIGLLLIAGSIIIFLMFLIGLWRIHKSINLMTATLKEHTNVMSVLLTNLNHTQQQNNNYSKSETSSLDIS